MDEKEARSPVEQWRAEIRLSEKQERHWRDVAKAAIDRYRGESRSGGLENDRRDARGYNILYGNTETLRSAVYAQPPKPDVRRRYRDADPVGRAVAECLERALSVSMELDDFDSTFAAAVFDYVLPGRGLARVRYVPTLESGSIEVEGEDGELVTEQSERLTDEKVAFELVPWDRVHLGPARRWEDVPWIAYEHHMTRKELLEKFGEKGKGLNLDIRTTEDGERKEEDNDPLSIHDRAKVYEIWDRSDRTITFIPATGEDEILYKSKVPLDLEGFYDCPRPLYTVDMTESLVPQAEFEIYRSQAEELDRLTNRLTKLISGMRNNGIYDSTIGEMSQLMQAGDNEFIPAADVGHLIEKGGLDKAIWKLPIAEIGGIVASLYQQREQVKQNIYEITGLSDILRGVSAASETATAQNIKAQYGGLRIQRRQRDVQRFARDLLRLAAEIMAEQFQPETLARMTGLDITPEMMAMLRDQGVREYRIDVETDSTIAPNEQADKEAVTQLLGGISQMVQGLTPAVQGGLMDQQQAKTLILASVRRFKLGRDVEAVFDEQEGQQQSQIPPQVQQQVQQMQQQMQDLQQKNQQLEQQAQGNAQKAQIEAQTELQKEQMRQQGETQRAQMREAAETQRKQMELQADISMKQMEAANAPLDTAQRQ
ncbi:hypothetical protein JN531_001375 [Flagellatimonas centrodinii]|uniref:hypothetical protein n=1 Tax=Flagellatimonas centrodinii TaxID=2806210 RepID=UPI001FF02619|nr:hypothetical protein [Flagellatimonas centrodinii]ULQ46949.1 hypothetical protein JN531_001375 [Flagellatimonas centrodinii]